MSVVKKGHSGRQLEMMRSSYYKPFQKHDIILPIQLSARQYFS